MSNEDKILSMLEQMMQNQLQQGQDIAVMKSDISDLKQGYAEMKQDNATMKQDIADLSHETKKNTIFQETEIRPAIRHIAEIYGDLVTRIDRIEPVVERTASDVSVIKAVVTSHSDEIKTLKSAI